MEQPYLYNFRIDAWTPDTLPMSRLAEYLTQLAVLFGNEDRVHFQKVIKGSAVPVVAVEHEAKPKVAARLRLVGTEDAPQDVARAQQTINRLLREDNASATLREHKGAKILEFKGVKTPLTQELVLLEQGEIDGVVIRIGGRDDSVPVTLEAETGQYYRCNTKRDVAKQLASHLFDAPIRAQGRGKWRRSSEGEWELDSFDIQSFELLEETSLEALVTSMRAIPGSEWNTMDSPQEELKKLREG
ncbi:hypothetical protein [Chitinimonas sp.]|uniref:hypothetical protein n=1 Tax=Chitinimonas sp. TaxID=1934313 RepID=UPI002F93AFD5